MIWIIRALINVIEELNIILYFSKYYLLLLLHIIIIWYRLFYWIFYWIFYQIFYSVFKYLKWKLNFYNGMQ